ncbi:MAG: Rne/Rng family ribonuclease, partial [Rhizobiales bacterium]|nr:Rne/Rng family ribonuclease [Hyphomicrobiales bacterium]
MANKMLIDASHPEETRVVVVKGDVIEDFDFESASKKQLRGNIYLAKVTRVEPSLQAAFVDYGGNRHGFLAFSEIHPDYYQIPVADRQALMDEEAAENREQAQSDEEEQEAAPKKRRRRRRSAAKANNDETISEDASTVDASAEGTSADDANADDANADDASSEDASAEGANSEETSVDDASAGDAETGSAEDASSDNDAGSEASDENSDEDASVADEASGENEDAASDDEQISSAASSEETSEASEIEADASNDADVDDNDDEDDDDVESIESEDALEEVPARTRARTKRYKIQEVIKRNQIILIQVVKEERGTKGAALTTYLSVAGRYCVLMPNTARGGGISRKITNASDRKRLRTIVEDFELPVGMGVILRTAGASRTKPEIKRDFEYLIRTWETVRDTTLESIAPNLVYEEGSLVKRSIRDLYSKDIDEVLVAGDEAYKDAKAFMKMLTPSHAKNVQPYKETTPIFARFGIEHQLSAMFSPRVSLPSGGYIIIDQTEALVAIDVNSGRATRAHNIEATALSTNMEAAAEVSRQFRLRDLAGLIVIDFIDMDEKRNNRSVERKLKECLKRDRARIQIGHISHFGLLEMSRQRMRSGVLEGSTDTCAHCQGTGVIRSTESVALHLLRMVEEALMKDASEDIVVRTNTQAALYILNSKREHLAEIETRFGVSVSISADADLAGIDHVIVRGDVEIRQEGVANNSQNNDGRSDQGRKRRRGGKRRNVEAKESEVSSEEPQETNAESGEEGEEGQTERKRGRRRGRRGGRGRKSSAERAAQENGE